MKQPRNVTIAATKKLPPIAKMSMPAPSERLRLEHELPRRRVQAQAHVAQVGDQRALAADGLEVGQLLGHGGQRLDLGLRLQRLDLDGALGLDDLLVRRGLREADRGGAL